MKLLDWLKQTKTTRYRFAERIGVQPSVITGYCKSAIWPGRERMEAIYRETNGQVTPNDFATLDLAPAAQGEDQPEAAE